MDGSFWIYVVVGLRRRPSLVGRLLCVQRPIHAFLITCPGEGAPESVQPLGELGYVQTALWLRRDLSKVC